MGETTEGDPPTSKVYLPETALCPAGGQQLFSKIPILTCKNKKAFNSIYET